MSEHGRDPAGEHVNETQGNEPHATQPGTAVNVGQRDVHGSVEPAHDIPEHFANPGLPPHVDRLADREEKGARRAERQVAVMFGISMVSTLVFLVAYFTVPQDAYGFVPGIGQASLSNLALGVPLGVSLLFIGLGAVHWAKTLMPDVEISEDRHPQRSSEEARDDAVQTIAGGGTAAQLGRRPLLKYSLAGALALVALPPVVQLAGSLGPMPEADLSTTFWRKGMRLMRDPEMTPIRASDVTFGSVFHVLPEGIDKAEHYLEEKAKAAVILIGIDPKLIKVAKEREWAHQGIVAYSKICTHVGCPVGLYERRTHHLLCPCHQSTFDVTEDCNVIFGPAKRPLPQLRITVDAGGYLVAATPFREAVGPSFWERG
jgi:ubiquinol-cytochrome c reductase iron-sulfur subunit